MSEKLKAFEKGTKVKWLSFFGLEGEVSLIRPPNMDSNQFQKYIDLCGEACKACEFAKNHSCSGLDGNGKVRQIETSNGGVVDVELEKYNAPCYSERVNKPIF